MTASSRATWQSESSAIAVAASLTTVALVAGRVVGLLAAIAGAAILDPVEFGSFGFATATAAVVAAAGTLGIPPLLTREVASRRDSETEARAIGTRATLLATASLALAAAIYLVVASSPARQVVMDDAQDGWLRTGVAAWAMLTGLNAVLAALLTAHRAFTLAAVISVARSLAIAAGSVAGAILTGSAAGVVIGTVVGEAVGLILSVGAVFSRRLFTTLGVTINWSMRRFAAAAFSAGAAALAIQGAMWIGQRLLLGTPDGLEQLAIFTLSTRLLLVITIVPTAIATVALPYLAGARGDLDSGPSSRHARRLLGFSLALACCVALVIGILTPHLLWLLDPQYSQGVNVVVLMLIAGVAMVANNAVGTNAVAAGRIRAWIASDWVLAIVLLVLVYFLVAASGGVGLALCYLVAYLCSAAFLLLQPSGRSAMPGVAP